MDDPPVDPMVEYALIIDQIAQFHHQWHLVDKLVRAWTGAMAVGFLLVVFGGGGFPTGLGAVILGASAGALWVTLYQHCRRSAQMIDLHWRALLILREQQQAEGGWDCR